MNSNSIFILIGLIITVSIGTLILFLISLSSLKKPDSFCNVHTPSGSYIYVVPKSIEESDGMLYFKSFDKYIEVNSLSADIECNHKFKTIK